MNFCTPGAILAPRPAALLREPAGGGSGTGTGTPASPATTHRDCLRIRGTPLDLRKPFAGQCGA
ncbi:hypothetical protein Arub01_17700 [Actinomadura rubrobrunea]|uniref:Uncharacterized protein n=1 Tax=Actinomadura rubrobrunea TaxID=115335 RepID=A0A9W6UTD4_9ACTN|nr:hypothetical protein Arub01_17700 [Actinomadura rubrobrunea]